MLPMLKYVRMPVALVLIGLIVADIHLGLGLGSELHMVFAAVAGALGVKRPGDLAERAVESLQESEEG